MFPLNDRHRDDLHANKNNSCDRKQSLCRYRVILLLEIVKQNESISLYPLHRFCFYREKSDIPLVHVTSSAQSAVDQQT